ncbi:MAG: hypothetical protein JSS35_16175 [Proteobacteria bacterium]|nr:hypothetical protein [Pseudomonadota bacterium]
MGSCAAGPVSERSPGRLDRAVPGAPDLILDRPGPLAIVFNELETLSGQPVDGAFDRAQVLVSGASASQGA